MVLKVLVIGDIGNYFQTIRKYVKKSKIHIINFPKDGFGEFLAAAGRAGHRDGGGAGHCRGRGACERERCGASGAAPPRRPPGNALALSAVLASQDHDACHVCHRTLSIDETRQRLALPSQFASCQLTVAG